MRSTKIPAPIIADCASTAARQSSLKLLFFNGILLTLCLSGCATKAPIHQTQPDFTVTGRIGVKIDDKGHSARFNWRQWAGRYEVDLWGPFGQGRTALIGDGTHMVISRGEKVIASGPPDLVMTSQLGWSLPLAVFPAWIVGKPAVSAPFEAQQTDGLGRLSGFKQLNWLVQFDRFRGDSSDALPGRIKARSNNQSVTLIVADFQQ